MHSKQKMLDLLSYKDSYGEDYPNTHYFIYDSLNKDLILNRMYNNLKSNIDLSIPVLEEHIWFLAQHSYQKSYPYIIAQFERRELEDYRFRLMDIFFEETRDIESLKKLLVIKNEDIFWKVADYLIKENEGLYVNDYVNKNLKEFLQLNKINTCSLLLETQDRTGIKLLYDLITIDKVDKFDMQLGKSILKYQDIEGIDELFQIFQFSFKERIVIDYFEQLYNYVINCIIGIAKLNQSYYLDILDKFQEKIIELEIIDDRAKYLRINLEGYKNEFYLNKPRQISIDKAIKIVNEIIH